MILLKAELLDGIDTLPGVQKALQQAIMLEHATLPPYLTALYSLKPGTNQEIRQLILSIVMEEMLHLALACNVLNAIGGTPVLNQPGFIPTYPGPLPGAVESELIVPLAPFSLDLVQSVFMVIEEPEKPLEYPVALGAATPQLTIGEFYTAIQTQLRVLGPSIFVGDPKKQVVSAQFSKDLIAVTSLEDAITAIHTIITQGEGTPTSPLDVDGNLAHYYRFAEIYYGKTLIPVPKGSETKASETDSGYVYGGAPIPFDPTGVSPFPVNPKASNYPPGSKARIACDTFNYTYTSLLNSLHLTFNGQPQQLRTAVGLMESLKQQMLDMADIRLPDGHVAAPSFEYQPVNP